MYTSQSLLIHSAAGECLDCLHMFWLHSLNSAAVNMNVHVSVWVFVLDLFEHIPASGIQVYYLYKIFLAPHPAPGVLPRGNSITHISGSRRGHMTCFGQWMQWEQRWPVPLVIRSLRYHLEALPWLLSHIQWSCGDAAVAPSGWVHKGRWHRASSWSFELPLKDTHWDFGGVRIKRWGHSPCRERAYSFTVI